ncbi:DUF2695 domain-containing protein [Brucella sp. MAB-22]|uniref:DUF2695 domain-containing protein n=1 Tax=Brucella sp. MAB-22 TaxID=2986424 RepID=UPI0039B69093
MCVSASSRSCAFSPHCEADIDRREDEEYCQHDKRYGRGFSQLSEAESELVEMRYQNIGGVCRSTLRHDPDDRE